MADILLLCVFITIWFVYLWIYYREPSKENLFLCIWATALVLSHVLVMLVLSQPGFSDEQRKMINFLMGTVYTLAVVALLGAKIVFDYLSRRGNKG